MPASASAEDINAHFDRMFETLESRLFPDGRKLARVRRRSDGAIMIATGDSGYMREEVFDEIERTGKVPNSARAIPIRYTN